LYINILFRKNTRVNKEGICILNELALRTSNFKKNKILMWMLNNKKAKEIKIYVVFLYFT